MMQAEEVTLLLVDMLDAALSLAHGCCCVQAPKTPLQKSMDLLGKQLSLYSLCIIGSQPVLRLSCLGTPSSRSSASRGHHAGGLAAGQEDPGHVHHRSQVTAVSPPPTHLAWASNRRRLSSAPAWPWPPSQKVSPSW